LSLGLYQPLHGFPAQRRPAGLDSGKIRAEQDDAVALLDYIAQYLDTADGMVPNGRWPAGVKGHFLVRMPLENFVRDCSGAISNADAVATHKSGE
jgi:predicted metal-binding protein